MEFIIGLIVGIFIIPTTKEIIWTCNIYGLKYLLKHPLQFIQDVFYIIFKEGY